jgi:hypothetical protein
MARFTTTLDLYGGVLWSGELQGFIIHERVPSKGKSQDRSQLSRPQRNSKTETRARARRRAWVLRAEENVADLPITAAAGSAHYLSAQTHPQRNSNSKTVYAYVSAVRVRALHQHPLVCDVPARATALG